MTREEIKAMFQVITMAYWSQNRRDNIPKEYMRLRVEEWYRQLQKCPAPIARRALDNHIRSKQFEPTISDILAEVKIVEQQVHREKLAAIPALEHSAEAIPMPDDVRDRIAKWKGDADADL